MPAFRWSRLRSLALGAALFGGVVVAYAPALSGDFLWDDDLHVTANPAIVGPLGLREIWTTSRANYFPLVLTNFWVQHALWGVHPLGYKIVTLACHAMAALLLWRVLRELRVPGSWLGAALWALHPVQVESVAWICELKNTQSAVFFLAAILSWLRWLGCGRERERVDASPPANARSHSYALALGCAVLALLSKPSTVMLPLVLALVTWWLRRRFTVRDLVSLIPFFALSAVVSGWAIWEQKFHSGALGAEWSQTWPERLIIAGRALWFYLGKVLWPGGLTFIYPRWAPDATDFLAYLPIVTAVATLGWLVRRRAQARPAFLVALYFVAMLFPVLGFFDVYFFRYAFVGDHFQYLASMAPLAALAAALVSLAPRRASLVGGVGCAALVVLTAGRCADFRSNETLWRSTLARNPDSPMAWAQLGAIETARARHAEAIACFQRALQLNPRHPEALNHLGCEYLRVGRVDDAISELEKAIAARSDFAEAQSNLGLALARADRASEALPHLELAQRLRPDAPEPQANYARTLQALGRGAEALEHFAFALRLAPGRAQTHDEYGLALAAAGRADAAEAEYRRAIELQPGLASAHNNLGVAFAQRNRLREALEQFDAAVQLDAGYAAAQINRGGALTALERLPEARAAFARAVELDPGSAKAHAYLGQVLRALGQESEAREQLDFAARLQASSR